MLVKIYISDLEKKGVYRYTNTKNNKYYVGSTTRSFKLRHRQHMCALKNNKHKNSYLQRAYNKDKEHFQLEILEIVEDSSKILEKEQYWMDKLESCESTKGYNINPMATGTPNLSKETIKKRSVTFAKTSKEAMVYYRKVKNKELLLEDVPLKYKKLVSARLDHVIWNKGLTKEKQDYSYLKVKNRIKDSEAIRRRLKQTSEKIKSKSDIIQVYDCKGLLIKEYLCIQDVSEASLKGELNAYIISNNSVEKSNTPLTQLNSQNISHACNNKIVHYKGLQFKFKKSDRKVDSLTEENFRSQYAKSLFNKYIGRSIQ